ncbi:MAG: hypothetical protein AB1414_02025 [bacterium]
MAVALPLEAYETFEKGFGKEDAKRIIRVLEGGISKEIEDKWRTTKDVFEERINAVRTELLGKMDVLEERINAVKAELLGKMEKDKVELLGKMEKDKVELLGKMEKDKAELVGKIEMDKAELLGKIEMDKAELLGKIEMERVVLEGNIKRLDMKMNFMIILMFLALTIMNPVVADLIKGLIK